MSTVEISPGLYFSVGYVGQGVYAGRLFVDWTDGFTRDVGNPRTVKCEFAQAEELLLGLILADLRQFATDIEARLVAMRQLQPVVFDDLSPEQKRLFALYEHLPIDSNSDKRG